MNYNSDTMRSRLASSASVETNQSIGGRLFKGLCSEAIATISSITHERKGTRKEEEERKEGLVILKITL